MPQIPKECTEDFDDNICPGCFYFNTELVPHPVDVNITIPKNDCQLEFWEDDF